MSKITTNTSQPAAQIAIDGEAGPDAATDQQQPIQKTPEEAREELLAEIKQAEDKVTGGESAAPASAAAQPNAGDAAAKPNADAAPAAGTPGADQQQSAKDGKDDKAGDGQGDAAAGKTEAELAVEKEIKELGIDKEKTAERFRDLSKRAADAEALRPVAQRAQEWENLVVGTGASPEQFSMALGVLSAFNSSDPVKGERALAALRGMTKELETKLGKSTDEAGADVLAQHQDLAAEVSSGDLTRKRAVELAEARNLKALGEKHADAVGTQDNTKAALDQAIADTAALNAELKAKDPQFAQKLPFLQPALDAITATKPPSVWVAEIRKAYEKLPALPVPAEPTPTPTPNPLRPGGGGGRNLVAEPKSALDAVTQALEAAGLG
ncbi:hypothetical protein [Lysobacter sp. CA199]|uniref:hypothetical protein n=1 Tax=Lysobacter sp. CA199 TaxID=3455608 RepID=UPI003F8D048A